MVACDSVVALHSLNYLFHSLDYLFHSLDSRRFRRRYLTSSWSDEAVGCYQQNCMVVIDFKVAIHSLAVHIGMEAG